MTPLKNKIIKNFIAGILSCILVFSILITMMVTINYNDLFTAIDDKRPKEVGEQFLRLNNDDNISADSMWAYLSNMAEEQRVDILYYDELGNLKKHLKGMDEDDDGKILEKEYSLIDDTTKSNAGKIEILYRRDLSGMKDMRRNFSQAVIYAITISLAIGLLIAYILSTNISKPIIAIGKSTLDIKEGKYKRITDKTDISEIETLKDNINFLSENLKRQESIRDQYAQDISHELRTPLTNLSLYIESIKDGVLEADDTTLTTLQSEVERLKGLIAGLGASFEENASEETLSKSTVSITDICYNISMSFLAKARKENISINTYLKKGVIFYTDKDKLSQILQNLISNAIKAIGSDGKIDVHLRETDDEIRINVVDNGTGIKKDDQDKIFERLYRVENSRNTKDNGLGLGLSITKNYVNALGGKISVSSEYGVGSDFLVAFKKDDGNSYDEKKEKFKKKI